MTKDEFDLLKQRADKNAGFVSYFSSHLAVVDHVGAAHYGTINDSQREITGMVSLARTLRTSKNRNNR